MKRFKREVFIFCIAIMLFSTIAACKKDEKMKESTDIGQAVEAKEAEDDGKSAVAPDEDTLPPPTSKEIGYAYGMILAYAVKSSNLDIDAASVYKGLKNGLKLEKIEIDEYEQVLRRGFIDAQKRLADKNLEDQTKFLEENKNKEGIIVTESGLQYKIINEGEGESPSVEDQLMVNYTGKFIDGTEFDSSARNGGPVKMSPQHVIEGWKEAMLLMKKGSKYELFIPSSIGYGDKGFNIQGQQIIPPNALLLFELEIVDIIKKEKEAETSTDSN